MRLLLGKARRLLAVLLTPITPGARRAVVMLFLLTVALAAANLFWTAHEVKVSAAAERRQAAAEQAKWCSLIVTLDQADAAAPKKPAPGTFTAAFVSEIHDLRQSLGC